MKAGATARTILAPVALGAAAIVLWQVLVVAFDVKPFLVPSPLGIAGAFGDTASGIVSASLATGLNALIGLLIGAVTGILVAIIANALVVLDQMLVPLVAALAVIPIVALAPIFYSMFGANVETGRQLVAAVAVFVPMYLNTLHGLRQVEPVHRDLMRAYAATPEQTNRMLLVPGAVPYVLTGLKIGSSLAVISALIAEYFGGPAKGLGRAITSSAAGSNYTVAWAYVLGAVLLGTVFYGVTAALENFSLRHRSGS
ncbi:ABC transporter permease subunit [Demequina capsici]|uniref:ABC transporter permease subunit n=1 Tax=Demequina capsici TaxID=3075620 RepID=A0AA96JA45_9MICO|nr:MULTISPECIES: ABC transporter permease subunit [unclassified Demequina]WNM24226.1 ABC transporter permease subunit [Demequina sp. OYTSA14]WNM27055.1 ABC transporter permease subunit [Demequina sp. PMTSA13]